MLTHNEESLQKAIKMVLTQQNLYEKNGFKRWICLVVGFIIGAIVASGVIFYAELKYLAQYDRIGLDLELIKDFNRTTTLKDLNIQELLAISFEYNSRSPRFFSKYF